ncbi:MAG: phospholipase D family protein [Burkholderiaceae bacterium]|nr:phospholipase D family protein [Burkholderiaceae bacterium]
MKALLLALVVVLPLAGCARFPTPEGRTISSVQRDTADTRLGRAVQPRVAAHPRESGVFELRNGRDAFAARALLAAAAQRTLDVQYYIWHDDLSGTLLFDALLHAAERGVRVRLLLDDNNTAGLDPLLVALDAHANIEVRLFNPFPSRRWRWLGYLTDFERLNRRMHNKSFTADNQVTIVGGRNVGDEYFGAGQELLFLDLDLMAIGPVVDEVSIDFDRYWASASAWPVDRIVGDVDAPDEVDLAESAARAELDPAAAEYLRAVAQQAFVRELLDGTLELEWAPAHLVSDDPAKGLGLAEEDAMLPSRLSDLLGNPQAELELVSPYFVPAKVGTEALTRMAAEGVRVRVLTNSLEATDVVVVHAGYARRRKALREAGVELFEMKGGVAPDPVRDRGFAGSSSSSLHAKTFAVDRARIFVGSFNFDPRSARLNTEMGVVVDSPVLADRIADVFDRQVPRLAYEVRLDDQRELRWIEPVDDRRIVHTDEPYASLARRVGAWLVSLLPVEWLL